VFAAFAVLALLLGALLAADAWGLAAALALLSAVPLMLHSRLRQMQDTKGMLLLAAWILMLAAPVFREHGAPIGYLLEAGLVFFFIPACPQLLVLARGDRNLRVVMLLFGAFMLAGLVSTVVGRRAQPMAAIWQILYNLKLPLMFMTGTLIVWNDQSRKIFALLVCWSWVPLLPCVLLEIAAPSVHALLFGVRPDWHTNPILGIGLRYRGLTSHPGALAIMCALLAVCAIVNWVSDKRRLSWLLCAAMYILLILLSGERQETAAFFLTLLFIGAIGIRRHWPLAVCTAALIAGAVLTWWCFNTSPLQFAALNAWGFGDPLARLSERGILYRGGIDVAAHYFPWGSGFGTYGGVGAQKFDHSLFIDLGFKQYWWFRRGEFLVDTYWPGILAETGVFGLLSLVACFGWALLTLVWRLVSIKRTDATISLRYGVAALALMLANSPSSMQLTDPRSAFLFWLLIGAACRATAPSLALAQRGGLRRLRLHHGGDKVMAWKKVVMAGPDTHGGMTSVIRSYLSGELAHRIDLIFLPSYLSPEWKTQLKVMGWASAKLLGLLLLQRVAVLHVHSASRGSFWRKSCLTMLAKAFRVPVVFHLHSGEFPAFYHASSQLAQAVIRWVLRTADEVVCLTWTWHVVLAQLEPTAKLSVIGNPVAVPPAQPAKSGLVRTVVFFGKLRATKGVFDLLEAIPPVLERYPGLRFVLAGDEGEVEVRQHAERLGIAHAVEVPGWISGERKQQLLREADLFVLPSHFEALGVAILEAMAAGVPVVATRVGGIPDLIDDGIHGLLVEPKEPTQLANAILRICDDGRLRMTLAGAAYARVRGTYSAERIASQMERLYQRLGYSRRLRRRETEWVDVS
jgi:glycosyltransferase involved in cell wall biosynthesis